MRKDIIRTEIRTESAWRELETEKENDPNREEKQGEEIEEGGKNK